jgi:membrane protein DedA with SNARE-associated domain
VRMQCTAANSNLWRRSCTAATVKTPILNIEIKHLIDWYQTTLDSGGYPLIAGLMAMESTILPIPSELVIPFAAQRAHANGNLSLAGIVLAGTIGSWFGATVMYWVCRWAGRPLVLRYGRLFLVPEAKVHAAEHWAARFGPFGVFMARLLPVVRHLIGIPMGIVEMDFRLYSLFTVLGSALWCSVLAWVGIKAGNNAQVLQGNLRVITFGLVVILAALGALYYFMVHRFMRKPNQNPVGRDSVEP